MRYRVPCTLYVLLQAAPSHAAIHDSSVPPQLGSTDGVGGVAGAPVVDKPAAVSEDFPATDRFMMQNSVLLPGHPAPKYGNKRIRFPPFRLSLRVL